MENTVLPKPSWEIAVLAHEYPDLILVWVGYHLALGAQRIHLFVEDLDPKLSQAFSHEPRVRLTHANPEFWQEQFGAVPTRNSVRQCLMLQHVLDRSSASWVVHIDVDEYLAGQGDFAKALAQQPETVDYATVATAERIYLSDPDPENIFDGGFRRCNAERNQAAVDRADGNAALLLDHGMTAYAACKSAFRTGRGLGAGVHFPRPRVSAREGVVHAFELLHFDGLTPTHWVRKRQRLLRRSPDRRVTDPPFRQAQMAEIGRRAGDAAGLRALYLELKQLEPERRQRLEALGLIETTQFDPRPLSATVLPNDLSLNLTMAAFDSYEI